MPNKPAQIASFDPYSMLRLVSRTFALGIEQLPDLLRESITVAYLMFRVSDFLEDNDQMSPTRKVELLNLWIDVLCEEVDPEALVQNLIDTDPDDPEATCARYAAEILALLRKLPEELQEYIIDEVRKTSAGMARWQARGPEIFDESDLDDYMFEVAGRVGHMLTHIFSWHAKPIADLKDQLMPLGREFGLALQTVNVIRGLRKDFERGWIFVPQSFCAQVGLKPPDLFKPENLEPAMKVVEMLTEKAERHLYNGLMYVKLIPNQYHHIRLFCLWPLFFAVRTLAISRGNSQVLKAEAKISRVEVYRIVHETQEKGASNGWLDEYYHRLSV